MKTVITILIISLISQTINLINAKVKSKISNGVHIRPSDALSHRYLVSLRIGNNHFCTGSIIHYNFIATVANCVVLDVGVYPGNIKILSNTEDYYRRITPGTITQVSYIIIHPDYIGPQNYWAHDIAILKLSQGISNFILDGFVQLVSDITSRREKKSMLTAVGFELNNNYYQSTLLSKIIFVAMNTSVCHQYFPGIHGNHNCAVVLDTQSSSSLTRGDGGSPLLSHRKLIGIISVTSVNSDRTAMYLKVFPYVHFIERIIFTL